MPRGAVVLLAALLVPAPVRAQSGPALSLRVDGRWVTWWEAERAPSRWVAPLPEVSEAVTWRPAADGLEWGELTLSGAGSAWRIRVILARLDPARLSFRVLVPPRRDDGFAGRWTIDDAPAGTLLALNAGQFTSGPWGWIVQDGVVRQRPGTGPLAPGVLFLRDGRVAMPPPDSLAEDGVAEAFQSYPALLMGDGEVPLPLRAADHGVDLTHRDSRLAFGLLRDGRVLIALTRFEGLGGVLEVVPFGFTTPEMAAVMGALGCARAVLLDGGLSGQMMLLEQGKERRWPGLRGVAAGLVVTKRN
ncbi:MAG TPA: phosphodiester glycosidase family protein [Gemmatimonadales bacterium]